MSRPTLKSVRQSAKRYGRSIRGLRDQTGSGAHLYHKGTAVAMHSAAPPPIEEYEAWLASEVSKDPRGKTKLDGRKLRRMVTMARNGCGQAEIGRFVGLSAVCVCKWLGKLPEGLRA